MIPFLWTPNIHPWILKEALTDHHTLLLNWMVLLVPSHYQVPPLPPPLIVNCVETYRRVDEYLLKGIHWKGWCWSWSFNTLATWCEELTHLKRPWCWERLRAGWEGDDKGWDGWMASLTRWTWVWVDSRSWWWTGRPGVLWFMGLQRVGHDWVTELNQDF